VLASAHEHGLSVESLTAREAMARFRGFVVDEGNVAVFERRAGYLRVEACVAAHLDEAARLGAEIHYDEPARQWHAGDSDVTVTTDRGTYPAGSLIVTAGPWAGAMLAAVGLRLEVLRKPQLWYRPTADDYRAEGGCPAFLFETSEGIFYGFPQLGPEGVKVAEHTGGAVVADPSAVDRALHAADRQRIEEFCGHALPGLSRECMRWAICMYTMSADRHFIVDLCHEQPRVALVAGLSGHGFKFTPVLGEAIADMVTLGTCGLPSELFGLDRVL
jgi:glycine/D-amino acid oxidase-like deaminating enzyme